QIWLERIEAALAARDVSAIEALFTPDATWRDQLAFQWDFKNWLGARDVAAALSELAGNGPSGFRLRQGTSPQLLGEGDQAQVVAFYDFETSVGACGGVVQLTSDGTSVAAAHLLTQLDAIAGHEWRVGA